MIDNMLKVAGPDQKFLVLDWSTGLILDTDWVVCNDSGQYSCQWSSFCLWVCMNYVEAPIPIHM